MNQNTQTQTNQSEREKFIALLEENLSQTMPKEGDIIKGKVTFLEHDFAMIDVGLKTEGRVPLSEFSSLGQQQTLDIGDEVDVYLEHIENAFGEAGLSREKAKREESWTYLEKSLQINEPIQGVIINRVKGGFTVDIEGVYAFLPGSQLDVRPIKNVNILIGTTHTFQILKMDRKRGNIVVSRRAIIEEDRHSQRSEMVQNFNEGDEVEGRIKNLTDYGAFIDLGGIDGLLHVTDMSWQRIQHPSELLEPDQNIKVKIIKINHETQRISLGLKQLSEDPWSHMEKRFPIGTKVKAKITNIADYGAFVELEKGVEGLAHISEMSWGRKSISPHKLFKVGDEIDVMILSIDVPKRRISLGVKQCQENPWEQFAKKCSVGDKIKGTIKNITEFGLFIGIEDEIDGMVHMSDLDWDMSGELALKQYQKGQELETIILDINHEKERISLGIKQLTGDPMEGLTQIKKGDTVTCHVTSVTDAGIEVAVGENGFASFIKRQDLARNRDDQRPDRFARGDRVDALAISFDARSRRIGLSIKALEIRDEKEAIAQYGSSDSGASLGDILGIVWDKNKKSKTADQDKSKKAKDSGQEAKEKDEQDDKNHKTEQNLVKQNKPEQ